MFRSLLVPLDGSLFGEHALPLALSISRRAGARLQLLRVHVPYAFMYTDSISVYADVADQAFQEQERAYLEEVSKRLAKVSVPVTAGIAEGMEIAGMVKAFADRNASDLIVMTTHGYGPLTRFWLGSVADELIRRSSVPVLLVRPQEREVDLTHEPVLHQLLIPLDGSELAEQVLGPAAALGSLMKADFTLLRVVPSRTEPAGPSEPALEQAKAEAQAYLERVAARLRDQALTVQTQVVSGKQAAVSILEVAQHHSTDLIALETHGRRGLSRLRLGSVADKVVRGACTPVLVHRSHEG